MLLGQLGYEVTFDFVRSRLDAIARSATDRCFVVERNGTVRGVIAVHLIALFHKTANLARITALVVEEEARGTGCGRALLRAVETFAESTQCSRLEVTSGSARLAAHEFYEKNGYVRSDQRFVRPLKA